MRREDEQLERRSRRKWGGRSSHSRITRKCQICGDRFGTRNSHMLFCRFCHNSSESLRFAEWIPEVSQEEIRDSFLETVA